jgi:hypothetical protein
MRAAGRSGREIAKRLGRTEAAIRQLVYIGRKNGWLDDDDEPVDLEAELAINVDRKVVRNINAALDGEMTNWQTHEMTIAAAKGRGVFKTHEVIKQEGTAALSVVAIQVVMPAVGASDQRPDIDEDQIGGLPAYLELEADLDAPVDARSTAPTPAHHPDTGPEAPLGAHLDGSPDAAGDGDCGGAGDVVVVESPGSGRGIA